MLDTTPLCSAGGSDSGTGEGHRRETVWYKTLSPHYWSSESGSISPQEERYIHTTIIILISTNITCLRLCGAVIF